VLCCGNQMLAAKKSYTNLNNTLEQVLGDLVSNGKNAVVSIGFRSSRFRFSL